MRRETAKTLLWTAGLLIGSAVLALAAIGMGRFSMSIPQTLATLFPGSFPEIEVTQTMRNVIFNIRLPRVLLSLLAGAGPGIAVQILPVGSVQAAFSTDFTTAGINQTRHRISLVLTANVQIVIPTGAKNVQASTQMAMAESIIVGQVPDSFAEGGSDNSIIDLAP